MIHINYRFSLRSDVWQWILDDYGMDGSEGKFKPTATTYHPKIEQVAEVIVDRSMEGVSSISEMMERLAGIERLEGFNDQS